MVMSSTCMMVAIMTKMVTSSRCSDGVMRGAPGRAARSWIGILRHPARVRAAAPACRGGRCRSRRSRSCRSAGGCRSWPGSNSIRSGTRCTILIQLPAAFCGGRMANCAPVPGLMAATVPRHCRDGKASTVIVTGWPGAHVGEVGFLGVGLHPHGLGADDAEDGHAGRQVAPHLDAGHLRGDAGDGRAQHGVGEVAPGALQGNRRLHELGDISRSPGPCRPAAGCGPSPPAAAAARAAPWRRAASSSTCRRRPAC